MNAGRETLRRPGLGSVVRDEIKRRIESGRWRPGERLPPEPDLARVFGVSRATLREALRMLAEDGWLSRTRGAGTYVTHRPRLQNNLDVNFGVSELIESMGMKPGTENLRIFDSVATSTEAAKLGVAPESKLSVIERVRTADGDPIIFSRDLLPATVTGDRASLLHELGQGTLYEFLERRFGVVVTHGVASIAPARADRWLGSQLRVPRGTLLLHLTQVDYDENGRAVLMSHEHHLADAFEVTVVRRGPARR